MDLTTGVGIGVSTPQLPGASPLRLHEAEARVSVCNRRGSGVGFTFGVGDLVERRRDHRAEGSVSRAVDNWEYDVTFGAIWVSFCYELGYKLIKLKPPILLYTVYFIFWGPFKFGGPMRSHGPHRPRNAPGRSGLGWSAQFGRTIPPRI